MYCCVVHPDEHSQKCSWLICSWLIYLSVSSLKIEFPKKKSFFSVCVFTGICFAFVIATIIQFASVHFFTKHGSGEPIEDSDDEGEGDSLSTSNNGRTNVVSILLLI